jgi:hypothetical protein
MAMVTRGDRSEDFGLNIGESRDGTDDKRILTEYGVFGFTTERQGRADF